jgi:enamine deaminase RidA (YjgF/YER057c/UK114 family)
MEKGRLNSAGCEICYALLKDGDGWLMFWYSITPDKPQPIASQIASIAEAERALLENRGIGTDTVAGRRFFSSDLITHHNEIDEWKSRQTSDFFLSLTDQPPAGGAKLALLGMCLSNITAKCREGHFFYLDTPPAIRHIFAEQLMDDAADELSDSAQQTTRIFSLLEEKLACLGASIRDNVLRTWIYAPHIDADYPGIVKARREYFDSIQLNRETHYIASTGIQGGTGRRFARVSMDAYATCGSGCGNVRFIQVPQFMSPTHDYGVTFERATAVQMGGADFLFISGTASIDSKGDIVHTGDVIGQTHRTLENISAVLAAANYSENNLTSFIVYLRDAGDYAFVRPLIDAYAGDLPVVYVKAAVCRPGWLIEIEATAARIVS